MPGIITGRSIAGRASAWAEVFSPTPMVTPSGTTLPLYDWSKFHRQKPGNNARHQLDFADFCPLVSDAGPKD
jgi:hypothetical protein